MQDKLALKCGICRYIFYVSLKKVSKKRLKTSLKRVGANTSKFVRLVFHRGLLCERSVKHNGKIIPGLEQRLSTQLKNVQVFLLRETILSGNANRNHINSTVYQLLSLMLQHTLHNTFDTILLSLKRFVKQKNDLLSHFFVRFPRWIPVIRSGGERGTQQSFIRGGSTPRSKPLPFFTPFLTEKVPL